MPSLSSSSPTFFGSTRRAGGYGPTWAIWALFAIACLAGLWLVAAVPPFGGHDEIYHWLRVVQIASGAFLAPEIGPGAWGGAIDQNAYGLELWFLAHFQQGMPIQIGEAWKLAQSLAVAPAGTTVTDFSSTAAFSPLAYVPQSLGVALARGVGANLLVQLLAGRIANLLCYLALVGATLRVLPAGRLFFFALATVPTTLYLAATLSADPLNFTLPALFIALCWRYRRPRKPGARARFWPLFGLTLALALLKPLALLFATFAVMIPATRFGGLGRKYAALAIVFGAGAAVCALWNLTYPFVPGQFWHTGADPGRMVASILADPGTAARVAWGTVRDWCKIWWLDSYGRFGGHPPPFSFYSPPLLPWAAFWLTIALCLSEGARRRDIAWGGGALFIAAAYAILLLAAFWLGFTRPGSPTIDGIQGRYFVFTYLLVGFALIAAAPLGTLVRNLRWPLFLLLLSVHGATIALALRQLRHTWYF